MVEGIKNSRSRGESLPGMKIFKNRWRVPPGHENIQEPIESPSGAFLKKKKKKKKTKPHVGFCAGPSSVRRYYVRF